MFCGQTRFHDFSQLPFCPKTARWSVALSAAEELQNEAQTLEDRLSGEKSTTCRGPAEVVVFGRNGVKALSGVCLLF